MLVALAVFCPAASAQTPPLSAKQYDHLWSEARHHHGGAKGFHSALQELMKVDVETGATSTACTLARQALGHYKAAARNIENMGEYPDGSHESPEAIRFEKLNIDRNIPKVEALKLQLCAHDSQRTDGLAPDRSNED